MSRAHGLFRSAAIAIALGWTAAGATSVRAETLADAISLAYQTSPALLASRADLRARNERYVEAIAALGPTASISAEEAVDDARVTQSSLFSPGLNTSASRASTPSAQLTLNQPLFANGQYSAAIQAARAEMLAGRARLRDQEATVIAQVVTAYADVLLAQSQVLIAQQNVDILGAQTAEILAKFKVKEVTITDRAQTRARALAAQITLEQARNALMDSQARFTAAVGQPPEQLSPLPPLAGLPSNVAQALESAEQNNPALLAAQYTEAASRARIAQAKGADGVQISLTASASRQPLAPYLKDQHIDAYSAGVVVSKTLFTSGAHGARVREARDNNDRDAMLALDSRRQAISNVTRAWNDLVTRRRTLSTLRDQLKEEEAAFLGSRREQGIGLRSTIDVLNAEQEFQSTKLSLAQSFHDEYLNRISLLSAAGLLRAEWMSPAVQAYRPEAALAASMRNPALVWARAVNHLDALGEARVKPTDRDALGPQHAPAAGPMPPGPDWSDLDQLLTETPNPPGR